MMEFIGLSGVAGFGSKVNPYRAPGIASYPSLATTLRWQLYKGLQGIEGFIRSLGFEKGCFQYP